MVGAQAMGVMGPVGASVLLVAACLAAMGAGVVRAIHPSGSDFEERRRVLSDFELIKEIHYAHSWGYETPPPPEIADYVTYFPPKKYGTERHRRELRTLITLRTQALATPPPPPPAPVVDDVYFDPNNSSAVTYDTPYDDTVLPDPGQPQYPVNVTAIPPDVLGNLTANTLQVYGTVPRYHNKFGIAMKSKVNGRWYTWIDTTNWYWGADDWSTTFWSCRYTEPRMPGGYDCSVDRTCPGCDRCRGKHCYYNYNTHAYCSSTDCSTVDKLVGIVTQAKICSRKPILCGMSKRVGDITDIGYPGYGDP